MVGILTSEMCIISKLSTTGCSFVLPCFAIWLTVYCESSVSKSFHDVAVASVLNALWAYEPHTTRLKFGERCFSHAGPKAWNTLPTDIQDLTDETSFKRRLKTFLFQQAYTVQ